MSENAGSVSGLRPVPSDIIELLLKHEAFHLVAHVRGDADSAVIFPFAVMLRKLGKRVACHHDVPAHLSWLYPTAPDDEVGDDAITIAVDTGNYSRLALPSADRLGIRALMQQVEREDQISLDDWWGVRRIDVVIDHHISNPGYGAINWIDAGSSSSAELITSLIVAMEEQTGRDLLDAEMAWRLFTGVASDTQWFERPVQPSAYATAMLLEQRFDIDKARIAEALRAQSEGHFRLGAVLRRTFRQEQSVASAFLDAASIADCQVTPEEAATMIEDLERLPNAISLLFVQSKPNEIRVRLRGKDVPVIDLAKEFGGGGHTYRAGAIVRDAAGMEQMFQRAIDIVKSFTK